MHGKSSRYGNTWSVGMIQLHRKPTHINDYGRDVTIRKSNSIIALSKANPIDKKYIERYCLYGIAPFPEFTPNGLIERKRRKHLLPI